MNQLYTAHNVDNINILKNSIIVNKMVKYEMLSYIGINGIIVKP